MAAVETLRLPTADELEAVLEAASALGGAVGGVRVLG